MNKELLEQAQSVLNIHDIYLMDSTIRTKEDFFPFDGNEQSVEVQFRNGCREKMLITANDAEGKKINLVRFGYEVAFRVFPDGLDLEIKNDEKKLEKYIKIEVTAKFGAIYLLNGDLAEESAKEFATYNVGYHVWPYWREYASSAATRLRLPAITIPLYQLPK